MKPEGNTVLITGGSTGIGFALAELFNEMGNKVIICGRRAKKLGEAKKKLTGIHTKVCDVSRESERRELIGWMIKRFGSFNILVNNAGIQQMVFLNGKIPDGTFAGEVITNLVAPIHLAQLSIGHLSKQREAAIINITSGLAFIPLAAVPVYCATKAGLHSFTVSLRHQLKDTGIRVFEVAPPIVNTDLGHDGSGKRKEIRGIQPSEVAKETLKALAKDNYELAIGQAAHLYHAAHSNKSKIVFERMNQ